MGCRVLRGRCACTLRDTDYTRYELDVGLGLQQILQIEPLRHHRQFAGRCQRPLLLGAVPIQLDAVAVDRSRK